MKIRERKKKKKERRAKKRSMDQEIKAFLEVLVALSYIIKDMYNCWLRDKIQAIHEEVVLLFRLLDLINTSFLHA